MKGLLRALLIFCVLVVFLAFFVPEAFAVPRMKDRGVRNVEWKPYKIYKNYTGVSFVDDEPNDPPNGDFYVDDDDYVDEDDWEVGLFKTQNGRKPTKSHKNNNWINGKAIDFKLVFTKATGLVELTIDANEPNAPVISEYYEEYVGLGMNEMFIIASSHRESAGDWVYTRLTDMMLNGQAYDFNDLDIGGDDVNGPDVGGHTYATITGMGCGDFEFTGTAHCYWIGKLQRRKLQAMFRFGEPCEDPNSILPTIGGVPGNLSDDCTVDFIDYAILASYWASSCSEPNWCQGSDFDGSGIVDGTDLAVIVDNWLLTKYGGGCGTEEKPFLIYTAQEMDAVGRDPGDWGYHFKVMADIDLSAYVGNAFNTIGDMNTPFTGVFDGGNHEISFFSQGNNGQEVTGFFRYVDSPDAVIKNVHLIDSTITSEGLNYAGTLVGKMENGLLLNCHVEESTIIAWDRLALPIIYADYIGGLVGYNNGSIIQCRASCNITGYDAVGGLVGQNDGYIEESFAEGRTIFGHDSVGGLIGYNFGTIVSSYSRKNVFAHDYVGGLIGEDPRIEDVNYGTTTVLKCYSSGHISENSDFRGGMIGGRDPNNPSPLLIVTDSFWDATVNPLNDNYIGTSLSTSDMKTQSNYTSAGWDFSLPIWIVDEFNDYPMLWWYVVPKPDPMTWANDPNVLGPYAIELTATNATAWDKGGVMYYFYNITDPNHHSGWQDSPIYVNTGLKENSTYTYTVRVRDKTSLQNMNEFSPEVSASTPFDTDPPQPDPLTWDVRPWSTSPNSITMTVEAAFDEGGVEYFFENLADSNHSSGWQDSPTYNDTGLEELTIYNYRVKARDKSTNQNTSQYVAVGGVRTQDGTPPSPDPNWASEPNAISPHSITMTAGTLTDPSWVQYYFENVTDPNHNSGWRNSPTYVDTGLQDVTQYTYRTKSRDLSSNYNQTIYSVTASATTPADNSIPTPDPMTWAIGPNTTGAYSIIMTATTAVDDIDVEYYFYNVTDPNHDSGWQDSPVYENISLDPRTLYEYQVKARDKSSNLNETAYSAIASDTTDDERPSIEEEWVFYSIAEHDGRTWNNGELPYGDGSDPNRTDGSALRLGDFSGNEWYRNIVSFDTSFLPEDCEIISATLELTRGDKKGIDPFSWGGSCIVDISSPYFGDSEGLHKHDWQAAADVTAVAEFTTGDPNQNMPMESTPFDANGIANINIDGLTQLKVYFTNPNNDPNNPSQDYLGFYSGNAIYTNRQPKLKITYLTRMPLVEFASIAEEDGRLWDIAQSGEGAGCESNDVGDSALRLGDFSGDRGYRNIVSFDTVSIPEASTIISANLIVTRGNYSNQNPFGGWGGDCVIDVVAPYFGSSAELIPSDWEAPPIVSDVARFIGDPSAELPMVSTVFDVDGMAAINKTGKTQLKFYFTNSTNSNGINDYIGFYGGEASDPNMIPKLLIRYKDSKM